MSRNRFKPLVFPGALLLIGAVTGWSAEIAVGRWQDYQMYSLARPVADLLLLIGAVWLVVALVTLIVSRNRARR